MAGRLGGAATYPVSRRGKELRTGDNISRHHTRPHLALGWWDLLAFSVRPYQHILPRLRSACRAWWRQRFPRAWCQRKLTTQNFTCCTTTTARRWRRCHARSAGVGGIYLLPACCIYTRTRTHWGCYPPPCPAAPSPHLWRLSQSYSPFVVLGGNADLDAFGPARYSPMPDVHLPSFHNFSRVHIRDGCSSLLFSSLLLPPFSIQTI